MNVIQPYAYIRKGEMDKSKLLNIEYAARLCYKSEGKMTDEPNEKFLSNIITRQHESVLEHEKVTVYFVVDRGVTHEIVRHRVGSYSQESTRYCNYSGDKFGNEITVIEPFYYIEDSHKYNKWKDTCKTIEEAYIQLLEISSPQEARAILPNSLKTEIAVTYNFREWRHFFKLRCHESAHPQMQQVTIPLLLKFKEVFSPIFDSIEYNEKFPLEHYGRIQLID
ncbi:FAD-dependent thymidylate synthase [Anaeromicropila populeti]|uniref:FAD-dependent thymidylate synthase n=1 Tax=Anaeromicropila populeti TaxID=37658 RepID=A0A1I6K0R1_9FIRM|nr:FAD-dependent thymidylate synthase [Anaeromicropila populeti]SFR84813.1 thymidylate synthase (FAD) [Anaeromicropila populeti]